MGHGVCLLENECHTNVSMEYLKTHLIYLVLILDWLCDDVC